MILHKIQRQRCLFEFLTRQLSHNSIKIFEYHKKVVAISQQSSGMNISEIFSTFITMHGFPWLMVAVQEKSLIKKKVHRWIHMGTHSSIPIFLTLFFSGELIANAPCKSRVWNYIVGPTYLRLKPLKMSVLSS